MIVRLIFLCAILTSYTGWAELFERNKAIPADKAIQLDSQTLDNNLMVQFNLAKQVYLYRDRIKITLDDGSSHQQFAFKETAQIVQDPSFGEVSVFFNQATLLIDRNLLPLNTQSIKLKYQGCDKAIGLCYPPQTISLAISTNSPFKAKKTHYKTSDTTRSSSKHNSEGLFTTVTKEAELSTLLNAARKKERLVLVEVYADWCGECKTMDESLFSNTDIQNQLSHFDTIRLDVTESSDFHKAYLESNEVPSPPALLFYGLDGNAIKEAQILREINKQELLRHLDQFDY